MPRRCLCTLLRQRIATDARLATLPMAAKWLWLSLAERAAETPDGQVPVGSAFGFFAGIAMLIQVAEPEVETHWETLAARGLVRRDGDVVIVPDLPAHGGRAAVSRSNGGLGGRPRKGETPEAARLRRMQGAMLLPVPGGATQTQGTQAETQEPGATSSSSIGESLVTHGAGKPETRVPHAGLGAQVAEIAGLDPIRQRFDYQPVKAWLAAGYSATLILATVREVVDHRSYDPAKVRTLAYFTPAIARAAEDAAPAPAAGPHRTPCPKAAAIKAWIASGGDWATRPRFDVAA